MGYNQNHKGRHHLTDPLPLGLQDRYPRAKVRVKDSGELGEEFHLLELKARGHKVKGNSGQEVEYLSKCLVIRREDHSNIRRDHLASNKGIHKVAHNRATPRVDHNRVTLRVDLGIHRQGVNRVDQAIHRQGDNRDTLKGKVSQDISSQLPIPRVPHTARQDHKDKHHPIQLEDSPAQLHTHMLANPRGQLAHRGQHHHTLWEAQDQPHTHKVDIPVKPLEHQGPRVRPPLTPWEDNLGQPPTHTVVPRDSLLEHLPHPLHEILYQAFFSC